MEISDDLESSLRMNEAIWWVIKVRKAFCLSTHRIIRWCHRKSDREGKWICSDNDLDDKIHVTDGGRNVQRQRPSVWAIQVSACVGFGPWNRFLLFSSAFLFVFTFRFLLFANNNPSASKYSPFFSVQFFTDQRRRLLLFQRRKWWCDDEVDIGGCTHATRQREKKKNALRLSHFTIQTFQLNVLKCRKNIQTCEKYERRETICICKFIQTFRKYNCLSLYNPENPTSFRMTHRMSEFMIKVLSIHCYITNERTQLYKTNFEWCIQFLYPYFPFRFKHFRNNLGKMRNWPIFEAMEKPKVNISVIEIASTRHYCCVCNEKTRLAIGGFTVWVYD